MDPGGFGAVTITKSITINASGAEGGILGAASNGIVINAGATDRITLRGLTLVGAASGLNGIRFLAGAELVVDNCSIEGFRGSTPSSGIFVAPSSGASRLVVHNTTISGNGTSASGGGGIILQPTGTVLVQADISDVRLVNNNSGLIASSTLTSNGVWVTIRDSQITGNLYNGVLAKAGATGNLKVLVKNNVITGNAFSSSFAAGIQADGAAANVRVQDNSISVNKTGLMLTSGGFIYSYGGNIISGNSSNGSFSSTMATQ